MSVKKPSRTSAWWTSYLKSIRYCYACGGRLRLRYVSLENQKRRVCLKCRQITYLNPKVVAGLIPVMPDGRVALLERDIEPARGKWTYPAGYQEYGETTAAAAQRETSEEIRVRVRLGKLLGIYSYTDAGVVTIVYIGQVLRGQKPQAGHESKNVKLFKIQDIPWKDLAFRSTRDALRDWKNQRGALRHVISTTP